MITPTFHMFSLQEEGSLAILTINRPETMNALNLESHLELITFAEYLETAPHLRVAIITGAGEKAFVAGADINNIKTARGISSLNGKLRIGLNQLEKCSKPVIAAVNGYAFGGGFELALACDIRLVSENAIFGLPETNLGIVPGAGGTQRLVKVAGVGVAKDVILGGRNISGSEAVTLGLAMKCVPLDQLMEQAKKLAKRIGEKAPVAVALAKQAIEAAHNTDQATGLLLESYALAILFESEDKLEGASAFLEKRTPQFQGR